MTKRIAVGIDLGGTNIVAGLVDGGEGIVLRTDRQPTRPDRGEAEVIASIVRLVDEVSQGMEPETIGIGCPGFVDPDNGVVLHAANLNWRHVRLAASIQKRTGIPVFIDNDVRLFTLAEATSGAASGKRFVLGITLGTGMSAALVREGELYRGGRNLAGEIGHVPVPGNPYPCKCGLTGCLETVVSATGMARLAREAVESGAATVLGELRLNPAELTAADVSEACAQGDPVALGIMEKAGSMLGEALSYMVPMISPDSIVIGGGASRAGAPLLEPLRRTLNKRLLPLYHEGLEVRQAKHGDQAGVIGSALYALHQHVANTNTEIFREATNHVDKRH